MSGASTPPPTQDGPSPLTVGVRFVKQYYKTLSSEKPETITRMYQPSSLLSVGLGSRQSHPVTFEETAQKEEDMKTRFVQEGMEDWKIRFEFENGAIDAQMSVNGGILLVATGHIVYESPNEKQEARRKAFVHTFFLGSISSGQKRSYYVHNDVLRFLADDEEKTVVISNKATITTVAVEKEVQLPVAIEEPPAEVIPNKEVVQTELVENTSTIAQVALEISPVAVDGVAPGGGVEETKEEVISGEEEVVDTKTKKKKEATKKEANKEKAAEAEPTPTQAKPTKFSWASVVGTGNGALPSSQPGTPVRGNGGAAGQVTSPPKTPKAASTETPAAETTASKGESNSNAANSTSGGGGGKPNARIQHNKRDPDCTLVIKNFDANNTTEADIRGMFEPYAAENEAKVVGCTVSLHKGLAFVDYDSPKPVLAAVDKHKKEAFKLKGSTLDIYQKTVEKPSSRRNQGGRGAGRGSQSGGGGGGGRPYRRSGSGGGRGERGGGGGGRGRGGR